MSMNFEINDERRAYLESRGKIVLNACPGSGKTTCVVKKFIEIQKAWFIIHNSHSGVACLSFTNIAKEEIEKKYKEICSEQIRYPHSVQTIDSFINQFITLPFFNLINPSFKRPKIVDDNSIIERALCVKFQGSDGKILETIVSPLNRFKDLQSKPLYRSYAPVDILVSADGSFTYRGNLPDSTKVDPVVFQEYGKAFFEWKKSKGLITNLDSSYFAYQLLIKNPHIGKWLIMRFPYLIIDEAQDNSAIQHLIFEKLIELGLNHIELVGDPYQSLYEWRGAKPHLFIDKFEDVAWTGHVLSHNRRSNQRIIDCFSILRRSIDRNITSEGILDLGIPITIYRYTDTNRQLIISDFESVCIENNFLKNHIVVRGNEFKDKMLGNNSTIEPWKSLLPIQLLHIKNLFDTQHTKEAVDLLRKIVLGLLNPDIEYHEFKDLEFNHKKDYLFNARLFSLISRIPSSSLSLQQWSTETSVLLQELEIDPVPFFEFKSRLNGFNMSELKTKPISDYFNKPATSNINIPISTIHKIKGATFDSLLFFISENSMGQNVSFNNFKKPTEFPNEKQRMIYVACSRPQQFLALAVPFSITEAQLKERFGNDILIKDL